MPGLSGVETFLQMKEFCPQTRVILMTAFALEQELALAMRQGAYAVIYKPFDIAKLLGILQDYLQSRSLVLLTDPDPSARQNLRLLLESKLYSVTEAQNAEECLQKIGERRFEVLLLDPAATRGSATDLIRAIYALRPDLAVILMIGTAVSLEGLKDEDAASVLRLQKPFEISDVMALLMRHLGPLDPKGGTE